MARLSMFLIFAKTKLLSLLVCFALGAIGCISLGAAAFAKNDRWTACRGADLDARIVGCTELIARGSWEARPNQIMAYINRGAAYRAKGDFDHALADLDKSLQLNPKSTRALNERALVYYSKGEFDRAIADYDALISAQSQSAAVFHGRGEAYRAKSDLDRAIADFNEAIKINPNDANAFLARANAYLGKHNLERAKQDLEAALNSTHSWLRREKRSPRQTGSWSKAPRRHSQSLRPPPLRPRVVQRCLSL